MGDVLLAPVSPEREPSLRYEVRFPPTSCRAIRVIQNAHSSDEAWAIAELNVYSGATEIARTNIQAVSANSNPWDIQPAFDNNPVTHWTSDERMSPDMTVTVQFSQAQLIDKVALLCPGDQQKSSMRVELLSTDGWRAPVTQTITSSPAAVPTWLRRASTEFLKSNGISWLVIQDSDQVSKDMFRQQKPWGISMVATDKFYKLYRIE